MRATVPAQYAIWDFDGTLAHRPGMWSGAILSAVRAAGISCEASAEDIRPFLQRGFPWHEPDVIREMGCKADDWWARLEPLFTRAIGSVTRADSISAERAARSIRRFYTDPATWELYADARPVLETLRSSGWVQFVLSNHVPELPAIMDALELSPYFARTFNSAETGVEKPHPVAFRQVLDAIPSHARVWMIGDSMSADILPATSMGINAILVRNQHPTASWCCRSLTEALVVLNGAQLSP